MLSFLLKTLNKYRDKFEKGGPLESLHPVYEATDTILFSTDEVTQSGPHIRDSIDTKYNRFGFEFNLVDTAGTVSYTHLTLPTKA